MTKASSLPAWDLSDLYSNIEDKKIKQDLQTYKEFCLNFAKKYQGKLEGLSSKEFAQALKTYEEHSIIAHTLGSFAYLNMVTQMKNQDAVVFYQNISEQITNDSSPLVFFSLEINQQSSQTMDNWLKDEEVLFYKPWLERMRRFKQYELSQEVEEVLLQKSMTSSSAWVRLYEETSSKLTYNVDGKTYNSAEVSKLLLSSDARIRKLAGQEINKVSQQNNELFTFIYNMIIKDKAIEDDKRGFELPISARNLKENVPDKSVDTLAQSVKDNYQNIAHRFYKLKAKWLEVDKISYWDRNAPLPFSADIDYSWNDATKLVLDSYKDFSPQLYNIAKDFFDNNWIDVPPRDGKRSGAFCASTSSKSHPYLLLNFTGKQNDVLTLSHELGHGCHHQTRINNGDLNEYSRLTTEEVASVFGEMITFQSMIKSMPDSKEKLSLLASKVSDMINTAIRQISFHFFEQRAHNERKQGELTTERLCTIWQEEIEQSLGKAVITDEDCNHIWSQIGHFFFLPFYVYAYSYADCLVNSLYKLYQEGKIENFADKYMDMLSKTAITDYNELLAPFDLDPNNPDFWNKGLGLISSYIDELERLDAKLFK